MRQANNSSEPQRGKDSVRRSGVLGSSDKVAIAAERVAVVRPILKWAGGKQALAAFLAKQFPADYAVYYEPFVGGASVLLALDPVKAVIGDSNEWLLSTYDAIRKDWRRVAGHLDQLKNTKAAFLRVREAKLQELDPFQRAAHLIYLNKTCFRGLFRVNRDGCFNVPYGAYKRRYYDPDNLRSFGARLNPVTLRHGDFADIVHDASSRDFIYFDPPYFKLGGYSDFNRYTPGQFRADDHVRLAALCQRFADQRVRWALTNSDTPFVRGLYKEFRIRSISSRREINLDSARRDMSELLITNY